MRRFFLLVLILATTTGCGRENPEDRGNPAAATSDRGSTASSSVTKLRLPATADIWISHATPQESMTSAGGSPVFKLKSVQEMAALRFDLTPARGHRLLSARLHLRLRHGPAPRWMRISTVSANWVEGRSTRAYARHDGANWLWADAKEERPWSWPGSAFCDVIMGEGFSQVATLPVLEEGDDWIAVEPPVSLITALICGHGNGLALMEGGSPFQRNYYFHSRQAWSNKPWLELTLSDDSALPPPSPPRVRLRPAPTRSRLDGGAAAVSIARDSLCAAWRVALDGQLLPPWRVPLPASADATSFTLEDLVPGGRHHLKIWALNAEGIASDPVEIDFETSQALATPPPLSAPPPPASLHIHRHPPQLWALPALAQLDPLTTRRLDLVEDKGNLQRDVRTHPWDTNRVWDGRKVHLVGARGETVSFQVIVQADSHEGDSPSSKTVPTSLRIEGSELVSSKGDTLNASHWSFSRLWYFHRESGAWQPSYLLPLAKGAEVPWKSEEPGFSTPLNRALFAEIDLDRRLPAGRYHGEVIVHLLPGHARLLPVEVEVLPFTIPRAPGFRIELNAYHWRPEVMEQFRLARKNRCVFTPWVARPEIVESSVATEGRTKAESAAFSLDWNAYDSLLGPLLDGSAFPTDPRPLEVLYLPFGEGWPTVLTPENYAYPPPWPKRGDPFETMWPHHETALPLPQALAPVYLERFHRAELAFFRHFDQKGWKGTELHCFFGSKMRDRTDYGHSTWWNTDEPLYWPDWAALRFYLELFQKNLPKQAHKQWLTRADISRPEWLRGALGNAARIVYTGGILDAAQARRCRQLARDLHLRWQVYAAAGNETAPPADTAAWVLGAWMDGARGALVWQTLAPQDAWSHYDPDGAPGTALLATWPEEPTHSVLVAGDLRLKALRDSQQLSEWLAEFARRKGYRRSQMRVLLRPFFHPPAHHWWHDSKEEAHSVPFGTLDAEHLQSLRQALAAEFSSHPLDSTP